MEESLLQECNGFLVDGSVMIAIQTLIVGSHWERFTSAKTRSPLVQIKRIEGKSFDSKEAAIQRGLELARQWIDEKASAAKNNAAMEIATRCVDDSPPHSSSEK